MPTPKSKTQGSLTSLRRAAADCRACPIWHNATKTVLATVHLPFVIRSRIGGGFDAGYAGFLADLKRMKRLPH